MTTVARRALEVSALGGHGSGYVNVHCRPGARGRDNPRSPRSQRRVLAEHIEYLASDELAGRGNGDEGLRLAAAYLAKQFEDDRARPRGRAGTASTRRSVSSSTKRSGAAQKSRSNYAERERPLEYPSDLRPYDVQLRGRSLGLRRVCRLWCDRARARLRRLQWRRRRGKDRDGAPLRSGASARARTFRQERVARHFRSQGRERDQPRRRSHHDRERAAASS